jgi:hypothetical protein
VPSRTRPHLPAALLVSAALAATLTVGAVSPASARTEPGTLELLTDPYLQLPGTSSTRVAWVTEFPGARHLVLHGDAVTDLTARDVERIVGADNPRSAQRGGVRVVEAETIELSRTREDAQSNIPDRPAGVVDRPLWRHGAEVRGLRPGQRTPYRVISIDAAGRYALSDSFTMQPLPRRGQAAQILLTSDHQSMPMTPANLQKVTETVGTVDAVLLAGDLVNIPDRASEWFDDTRGGAFFPSLQGNAARATQSDSTVYAGGEILQHAPIFPVIGNHEVMGRVDDRDTLGQQYNAPVPVDVAEAAYGAVASEVNPTGDPEVRAAWIEDNSFSTTTYEELFDLPTDSPGGEKYWAYTVGDVRVIGLYATRIWRTPNTNAAIGRFTESTTQTDPLRLGYGTHIFEPIDEGSEQLAWLADELASPEFRRARYSVVMTHHAIHGLGDNVLAPFTDPVRIEERDDDGRLTRIRYEYPKADDHLVRDLKPMLQEAGVDLVLHGHSHLWNRFEDDGVNYLETSNVGNNYGAYTEQNGRGRAVPPAPWDPANYTRQGDPAGLLPVVPSVSPLLDAAGLPEPYVASNRYTVFSILDTGDGSVTSYAFDTAQPDSEVFVLDRFGLD